MNRCLNKLLCLVLVINQSLSAKILIMTSAYNRPDLVELQYRCLNKFVQEPFDLVVFNDAEESHFRSAIEQECGRFGIRHIPIDQAVVHKNHQAGVRGWDEVFSFKDHNNKNYSYRVNFREGEVIQYAFDTLGFEHDDIVVSMDLDCFPIRNVSIRDKMENHLIAGYKWRNPYISEEGETMLPILMVFNMPKLQHRKSLNFNSGFIGSRWIDLCNMIQIYTACHDIKIKDWCSLGHVACSKLGRCFSVEELVAMGYHESTAKFVKKYYQRLFKELGYVPHDIEQNGSSKGRVIFDLGQIMDYDFFHFNQCTNWMGAYNHEFMTEKSRLVREFVMNITS